jgi:DNA repair photolyase
MEEFSNMPARRGRAAATNPATRFDRLHVVEDPSALDDDSLRQVPTLFFRDSSRSALARNDSPDIPFTYSLNPYRGCEHGCIYCYARPSHEYLGFSAGLDFETRILVKEDAPELLEQTFRRASWEPQLVALSGNTDPYQPVERRLGLTRRCLEVFLKYRNPVSVVTKNRLVLRDLDLLTELAAMNLVRVTVSITTLDPSITAVMEPRTARPELRLKTIEQLAGAGIPVGVNVAPVIPGLTDEEMPAILKQAAASGATSAYYQIVRLPLVVKELFVDWLHRNFPDRADKIVRRLLELHGGRLNESEFVLRMRGRGEWAETIDRLFKITCKKLGIGRKQVPLATHHFRRDPGPQLDLFGPESGR